MRIAGLFKKSLLLLMLFSLLSFLNIRYPIAVRAATVKYVDKNLTSNCAGNYSKTNRNCSGSDGDAYTTLAAGFAGITAGDTLYIRAGTYSTGTITLGYNSTATTTIAAYNDESVTLTKPTIREPLLALNNSAKNITFYGLRFSSNLYNIIPGPWTNQGNNIWSAALQAPVPTQIKFNNTLGTEVSSQSAVNSTNKWFWTNNTLYIYSTSNPSTAYTSPGISQTDNYDAIGIGQSSGTPGNLITIDNCYFTNFAHVGVKGNFKFWVKNSRFENIGTDFNDHHLYFTGIQSAGNETIIENNYFGYTPGAALHFYTNPGYIIVRNNIINGLTGTTRSFWGILLSGDHIKVYNNTIYGSQRGLSFYSNAAHDNDIKNNIFFNNNVDLEIDSQGGVNYPKNNISMNNYFGSSNKCNGCTNQSGSGGDNYSPYIATPANILGSTNPFKISSPSNYLDFALASGSSLINAGVNLGSPHNNAFDSSSTTWPLSTADQNSQGSGWEIGAYVFKTTGTTLPTGCKGDYNGSGTLDISDFGTFGQNYKKTGLDCNMDIVGGNCFLDVQDFAAFAQLYKQTNACVP